MPDRSPIVRQDVEFYDALAGGAPVYIGGGTFEEFADAVAAGNAVDAAAEAAGEMPAGNYPSPGTYDAARKLGANAGVLPDTDKSIRDYNARIAAAHRDALRSMGSALATGLLRPSDDR